MPIATLSVSSVSPASGSSTGGTPITITGTNFGSDTAVTIGGTAATGVTLSGSTSITAVTPAHSAGAAAVIVTSGGLSATSSTGFTFVAPSGTNQPPVISSIRSVGTRINQASGFGDIGESVTLIATVTDAETPTSALTYAWTVAQGTVSGTGASVTWTLPATLASTPATVNATLMVTEQYTESGVAQRNTTTGTFAMSVHDSQKEILDMGQDFLELFSQSQYTPDQVLHNFSATCDGGEGRSQEYGDVADNRTYYLQLPGWSVSKVPPVTFNFGGQCAFRNYRADACSRLAAHWYFTVIGLDPKVPNIHIGDHGESQGVDYVTAVLENDRWKLCHSGWSANEPPANLSDVAKFLWRDGGGIGRGIRGPIIR